MADFKQASVAFTPKQWAIAALLFLMILLNYLDRVVLSLVSPVMRQELGLSTSDYATAVNAFLIAYGIMYLGSGLVIDRMGARAGVAVFVGAWSVASGLHALTAGLASLAAFRFLLGVTEPGGWTGAVKTVSERFAPAQRGTASGIFTAGAGVGALIAPPVVVFLTATWGWRSAFAITALAGLFWIPVWLLATRDPAARTAPVNPLRLTEMLRLLGQRRALAFAWTRFCGDTTGYFFLFWLPEYLVSARQFTMAEVGALAWIPFLWQDAGSLLGGYASSRLVQRWGKPLLARKTMMSVAAVFVILGTLVQSLSEPLWVIVSVSLCTFGVGIWATNMHATAADAFHPRDVASMHGLAGSAGAVGGIVFNTLVGRFSTSGNYAAAFAVLALLQPIANLSLWLFVKDENKDVHADRE